MAHTAVRQGMPPVTTIAEMMKHLRENSKQRGIQHHGSVGSAASEGMHTHMCTHACSHARTCTHAYTQAYMHACKHAHTCADLSSEGTSELSEGGETAENMQRCREEDLHRKYPAVSRERMLKVLLVSVCTPACVSTRVVDVLSAMCRVCVSASTLLFVLS